MPIPSELSGKIAPHLNAAGVECCPLCRANDWTAHAYARIELGPEAHPEPDAPPAPAGFPCAALCCGRCGFTALINLVVAGLAPA